jgi:hypothetical protein
MAHWMLTPLDHRAEIWRAYPVQRIVVEARNEREARKRVADVARGLSPPNPWLDRSLTCCEQVEPDAAPKKSAPKPAPSRVAS